MVQGSLAPGSTVDVHIDQVPATSVSNETTYLQAWILDPGAANGLSATDAVSLVNP